MTEVTAEDFSILHEACTALDAAGVPYVIGGGTVVVLWGRNRRTKDFDLFLNREVLRAAMAVLSQANFTTTDTEKMWLYKAWRGETLVDLIVESRGGTCIDSEVLSRSRIVRQYGYDFRVMGPEDTLYRKILTLTEGRPDWHDAMSIVERQQGKLDGPTCSTAPSTPAWRWPPWPTTLGLSVACSALRPRRAVGGRC